MENSLLVRGHHTEEGTSNPATSCPRPVLTDENVRLYRSDVLSLHTRTIEQIIGQSERFG